MCAIFKISLDKSPEIFNKLKERYSEDVARKYIDATLYPKREAPVIGKGNKVAIMNWGFPLYNKKEVIFNTRYESLTTKKIYADILDNHCVVPATAFYEFSTNMSEKKKYLFSLEDDLFYFAGLWKRLIAQDGTKAFAFTIITTAPNEQMSKIHGRMPFILKANMKDEWLNVNSCSNYIVKPFTQNMIIKEAV